MAQSGVDIVGCRLQGWQVKRIFGRPGDGLDGITGALGRARKRLSASQHVPEFPYAEYAPAVVLSASRVDDPEDAGPACDHAAASVTVTAKEWWDWKLAERAEH